MAAMTRAGFSYKMTAAALKALAINRDN